MSEKKFLEILGKMNKLPEADKNLLEQVLKRFPSNKYFNTIHKLELDTNISLVLEDLTRLITQLDPTDQQEIYNHLYKQNKTNKHAYIRTLHNLIPIVTQQLQKQDKLSAGGRRRTHIRRHYKNRRTQKK